VFVRLDWKKLTNNKHSSLIRKSVIYGRKKFYDIGPEVIEIKKAAARIASSTVRSPSQVNRLTISPEF
jgi:hypothetical protein